MYEERPILVTGMPRSGTTWVGKTLSNSPGTRYVHEPFNITSAECACGIHFDKWFYYIHPENEAPFRSHLEHTLGNATNKYHLVNVALNVRRTRSTRPLRTFLRQLKATRTVMKDPLAACSAAWLSSTFNMKVIVMVRHPAAIVSSYKQLGWSHPFSHFLALPRLINDYLHPFVDEIKEFAFGDHDIVEQAALLWKLIYHVLREQSAGNDDWLFMRYEDLAVNAEVGFRNMLETPDLTLTDQMRDSIRETTSTANLLSSTDPYSILRNSEKMIWQWKLRLSDDEIARVRARVGDLAKTYYSDEDW